MVRTVFVVEDEPELMEIIARVLDQQGFTVLQARDASECEARLEEFTGQIDLLLTDVVLPIGLGREVAKAVQAKHPGCLILFMSGYLDLEPEEYPEIKGENFLPKPFTILALSEKIKRLLTAPKI
ncbi:MAG: response regulator [Bdellovibrionia bacterium]